MSPLLSVLSTTCSVKRCPAMACCAIQLFCMCMQRCIHLNQNHWHHRDCFPLVSRHLRTTQHLNLRSLQVGGYWSSGLPFLDAEPKTTKQPWDAGLQLPLLMLDITQLQVGQRGPRQLAPFVKSHTAHMPRGQDMSADVCLPAFLPVCVPGRMLWQHCHLKPGHANIKHNTPLSWPAVRAIRMHLSLVRWRSSIRYW